MIRVSVNLDRFSIPMYGERGMAVIMCEDCGTPTLNQDGICSRCQEERWEYKISQMPLIEFLDELGKVVTPDTFTPDDGRIELEYAGTREQVLQAVKLLKAYGAKYHHIKAPEGLSKAQEVILIYLKAEGLGYGGARLALE